MNQISKLVENLKKFLGSKKAKAFLAELVVLVCVQLLDMSPEKAQMVSEYSLYLTIGYMGAQGVADIGKGKAEVEHPTMPPMP